MLEAVNSYYRFFFSIQKVFLKVFEHVGVNVFARLSFWLYLFLLPVTLWLLAYHDTEIRDQQAFNNFAFLKKGPINMETLFK